jgi:hypothetical protein
MTFPRFAIHFPRSAIRADLTASQGLQMSMSILRACRCLNYRIYYYEAVACIVSVPQSLYRESSVLRIVHTMYRSWCISLDTSAAEFVAKQLHMYRALNRSCAQCSCFRIDDRRWANGNGNYFRIGPPKKARKLPAIAWTLYRRSCCRSCNFSNTPPFWGTGHLAPGTGRHVILGLRSLPCFRTKEPSLSPLSEGPSLF